jgi:hypothetical protein
MEEPAFPAKLSSKRYLITSNLKRWTFYEWAIFWGFVPVFLFLVYALPQAIKNNYFILTTAYPWRVQTWVLSSYTHSQLYPHLIGNLIFYFVVLSVIFVFENKRSRFWLLAFWSFCVVPVITSFLTIGFWSLLDSNTSGQGFSAINGALLAYAILSFSTWGMLEFFEVINHPEKLQVSKLRFHVGKVGMVAIVILIIIMGFISGLFFVADGATVNGLAHFGGFFSGLIVLLIFDLIHENRKIFDQLLGLSILAGIFGYAYYLFQLVRLVKGQ